MYYQVEVETELHNARVQPADSLIVNQTSYLIKADHEIEAERLALQLSEANCQQCNEVNEHSTLVVKGVREVYEIGTELRHGTILSSSSI